MSQPAAGSLIVERLVGATGEPDKVTAAARALGERAALGLPDTLGRFLSDQVHVELVEVQVCRMADAIEGAGEHDALTVATSTSSPDALTMRLDAVALSLLVDAMFGCSGEEPPRPFSRPLTAIELDVAGTAFNLVAETFNGTGARAMDIRFPLPPPATGDDLRKTLLRDGPAARLTFSIGGEVHRGILCVTMPQRVLLKPRSGSEAVAMAGVAPDWQVRFGEEVKRSRVKLEATVPVGKMTLGAISLLREGQIIEMPEAAQGETRLSAKDKTLFICEFGRLGQHYTVRIRHPFDTGQDLMDGLA